MTDRLPTPTHSPEPWYQTCGGVAYLTLLGIAVVATLVAVALPGGGESNAILKLIALGWAFGALDVLLVIGIAVGVFRRRFWRLLAAPLVDLLIGVIVFLLSAAAVVIFLFYACMSTGAVH
jgi:hypothetical protein